MKNQVFISSVQKELEPERLALLTLLTTDPFLKEHAEPVLFEKLPPPPRPTAKPYLAVLKKCQIYVLLIDREYAPAGVATSPTREEYAQARKMGIPALALVKGRHDAGRDPRTREFFEQIKRDGFTYKRFTDRIDLKQEVSAWLWQVLKEVCGVEPAPEVGESGTETIEATSAFESGQQTDVTLEELDPQACHDFHEALTGHAGGSKAAMYRAFRMRGLLWADAKIGVLHPTAAGVVMLGSTPSMKYLQCQVLADAYQDTKATAKPWALGRVSGPLPRLIKQLLAFVRLHTAHPARVVGINNVTLDEYPSKAIREVLVNAFAHRDYADAGRKIRLEIFKDRIVVSSPGYPPKPLTLAKLRKGNYESCRRNPVIAECLATLGMMEQRGSGFERIRAAMLDHGLDAHRLEMRDGYFKVILPGPNGNYDRIRTPEDMPGLIPPSVEMQLNDRQKKIMIRVQTQGVVTSGWCRKEFGVSYDTTYRDLTDLVRRGLLVSQGKGRATHYALAKRAE